MDLPDAEGDAICADVFCWPRWSPRASVSLPLKPLRAATAGVDTSATAILTMLRVPMVIMVIGRELTVIPTARDLPIPRLLIVLGAGAAGVGGAGVIVPVGAAGVMAAGVIVAGVAGAGSAAIATHNQASNPVA